ncbi:MAG: bacteriohopanetetrol glucosamine biosynthesis glycosyltransferase HpnI [Proteobacteria bacterium]|nr:bacteriohopanetetrol glucosamine biosynthesis glycosyltransferase HpnI [Pseudomonadota bacterium]
MRHFTSQVRRQINLSLPAERANVMLTEVMYFLCLLALATNVASAAYVLIAIRRVEGFRVENKPEGDFRPPVTVLKPVCGLEANLYENLSSFCQQEYPEYQVIFGVRDATDPAIPVIQRILDENPERDMTLIIDDTVIGPNFKVSNLDNMDRTVKHPYLAIADSDMRVDDQYIASVIAPFADPKVGVVTCLYKASAAEGLVSILGSMFINGWFLPSVLVSAGMREVRFGLGATIMVRRDVLEQTGGFRKLAQFLADDHMLGKLASAHGFKVVLSSYVVENVVFEKSLNALLRHELRWARTVRTVEPLGHAFSFIMYGVPLAFLGALLIDLTFDWDWVAAAMVVLAIGLRIGLQATVSKKFKLMPRDRSFWLVPLRDILSFLIWGASFLGRGIHWKDSIFTVNSKGLMTLAKKEA